MHRRASDLAGTAYEAVRALNHATYPGQCEMTRPDDAYSVLCSLASLVYGLGQALDQLARWTEQQARLRQIIVVDGPHAGDPVGLAAALRAHVAAATASLSTASAQLSEAHQLMSDVAEQEG